MEKKRKNLKVGEFERKDNMLIYMGKDRRYKFKVPRRASICQDIYSAATTNPNRALAAAVGLSMLNNRPQANYQRLGCSTVVYGGAVLDEMVERGWNPTDVLIVGQELFKDVQKHLISFFPSSKEVDESEDFLEDHQD